MEERSLQWFALILSVVGLLSLYMISNNVDFNSINPGKISVDDIGRNVNVCGDVKDIYTSKSGHTFFTINDDSGSIKGVDFNSDLILDGKCFQGRVDIYHGELELIVERVDV